ncbi:MAG TPA: diguanylate cyclase, partial [Pseudomonadales bacterium]
MRLHGRIFALVLLLLVGLGGTNLIFFYTSARDKVERDVTERLLIAERSFVELFENRQSELVRSVNAVVNDWGLRQAIGQQDPQTARDVLVNHSTRVGADIALFIDRQHRVFAATQPVVGIPQNVEAAVGRPADGIHLIAALGDSYYQLVLHSVKAPVPLGSLAMGFLIDDALAERLSQLSDVEVSFIYNRAGDPDVFASSLGRDARALAAARPQADPADGFWQIAGEGFEDLVLHHGLDPDRPGMQVALQRSLRTPLLEFRSWWWSLATIFALMTLLALSLAWIFSRGLTRPLSQLINAVTDMEAGDYSTQLKVERNDEIGSLSRSFIRMQRAIADREDEIRYRADHDLTTNVLNRSGFLDAVSGRIELAAGRTSVAVVCLRLNHFQQIVDALGHAWGDRLLELVADRLGGFFADSDIAHVNSDEFFLSFSSRDVSSVFGLGEGVHACLGEEFLIRGISLTLTGKVGVSVYPDHANDGQTLLRKASVALNDAAEHHR